MYKSKFLNGNKKQIKESEIIGHWLVVSLDNINNKAVFICCKTEKLAEKFKYFLEEVTDITLFSVDFYGKSTYSQVESYFKNYDVAGLLFFEGKEIKKLTKTTYTLLQ